MRHLVTWRRHATSCYMAQTCDILLHGADMRHLVTWRRHATSCYMAQACDIWLHGAGMRHLVAWCRHATSGCMVQACDVLLHGAGMRHLVTWCRHATSCFRCIHNLYHNEDFKVVYVQVMVFWIVTPCSLVVFIQMFQPIIIPPSPGLCS
jgi:hypothetical protein